MATIKRGPKVVDLDAQIAAKREAMLAAKAEIDELERQRKEQVETCRNDVTRSIGELVLSYFPNDGDAPNFYLVSLASLKRGFDANKDLFIPTPPPEKLVDVQMRLDDDLISCGLVPAPKTKRAKRTKAQASTHKPADVSTDASSPAGAAVAPGTTEDVPNPA